jgi:hypothetical protein
MRKNLATISFMFSIFGISNSTKDTEDHISKSVSFLLIDFFWNTLVLANPNNLLDQI